MEQIKTHIATMALVRAADHPLAARIAASCLIAGPLGFWAVERWVSWGYYPSYSYIGNFTSDLAVPYPFIERTYDRPANSTRARWMNVNFYGKAWIFCFGHMALLYATGRRDTLTVARAVVVGMYTVGLHLVAWVPGGNREHDNGSVKWHSLGAMLAINCGNISAILAGCADADPTYRRVTIGLGSLGIVNLFLFIAKGRTPWKGFWQRASLYTTQSFELLTGFAIMTQLQRLAN